MSMSSFKQREREALVAKLQEQTSEALNDGGKPVDPELVEQVVFLLESKIKNQGAALHLLQGQFDRTFRELAEVHHATDKRNKEIRSLL